jgi:acetyl-CoA carboxylase biotin carboxyl carrier protein
VSADLPLSPEDVAEIVSILDRTPYDRIDIRCSRFSLAVVRSGSGWSQCWDWSKAVADSPGERSGAAEPGITNSPAADVDVEGFQTVKALLPGTFYRAAQPGAAPFIEVGSNVRPDSVIGIIETMKLMTPVHAGVSGVVVALLAENTSVVDAGTPIIRIKWAGSDS